MIELLLNRITRPPSKDNADENPMQAAKAPVFTPAQFSRTITAQFMDDRDTSDREIMQYSRQATEVLTASAIPNVRMMNAAWRRVGRSSATRLFHSDFLRE